MAITKQDLLEGKVFRGKESSTINFKYVVEDNIGSLRSNWKNNWNDRVGNVEAQETGFRLYTFLNGFWIDIFKPYTDFTLIEK